MKSLPKISHPPLSNNLKTEVCVVGAGIAGLSTAYFLACEGVNVIVLEAKILAAGETQKTTAHLSNAIDDRYYRIEQLHGLAKAKLAAQSHTEAIDKIETIIKRENIDCDFQRLDGRLFSPDPKSPELEKELEAAHRAGLIDVRIASGLPITGLEDHDYLLFPNQAQFHPLLYLQGLARAIHNCGGKIFTQTAMTEIENGDSIKIKTDQGFQIEAKALVLATNTPIINGFAIHTKQTAYQTYAIGVEIPVGSLKSGLYWDTWDPYHYIRLTKSETTPTDNAKNILIVGGEDHKTGQATNSFERFQRLSQWTRNHFPQASDPIYFWSGEIMETLDGLAFIGLNPAEEKNIYIATGDSGMGMTHGTIAGLLLTDLIQQRNNPWAEIYDPSRAPWKIFKNYAKKNWNVICQYTKWIPTPKIQEKKIKPGQGAIIQHGLEQVAVYRDEQGNYHEMSAVCPHFKARLCWNAAEKTWDCPAHGSRFDCYGKVIHGPAMSNLTLHKKVSSQNPSLTSP
ncbi:MAG: FAD-dependent oxidoreductase [Verrucomicrobiae bacterium]|nr:FAD-dependent oxidoreductase [Verrucomicrobiae bacterium]